MPSPLLAEPADAAIDTAIASTPFDSPTGTSVQVEVLDGNNHRVTSSAAPIWIAINAGTTGATLTGDDGQSGTVTKNAAAGVASFSSLKIDTHGNYNLIATSPGLTSAISNSTEADGVFTIWDSAQSCVAGKSCTTTLGNTSSFTSQFSGTSSTGGFLLLTLGQDTLSCGDTFNHAPSVSTVTTYQFSATGNKTIVGTIDKTVVQAQPNNGVSFYRVCFESDDFAFTYPGGVVKPAGTPFLLPDCKSVAARPRASSRSRRRTPATCWRGSRSRRTTSVDIGSAGWTPSRSGIATTPATFEDLVALVDEGAGISAPRASASRASSCRPSATS